MLFVLGSVFVGFVLYKALKKEEEEDSSVVYDSVKHASFKVKKKVGALSLPPCHLIAVQLGPSEDKRKIILSLYLEGGDVPHETFKPLSDLKTPKYVKLFPTDYSDGITLTTSVNDVPIVAYYK